MRESRDFNGKVKKNIEISLEKERESRDFKGTVQSK